MLWAKAMIAKHIQKIKKQNKTKNWETASQAWSIDGDIGR